VTIDLWIEDQRDLGLLVVAIDDLRRGLSGQHVEYVGEWERLSELLRSMWPESAGERGRWPCEAQVVGSKGPPPLRLRRAGSTK
jgi:hypothetical protein